MEGSIWCHGVFLIVSSTPCFLLTAWHFDMVMSYFSFPSTALPSFMSLSVYLPLSNYIYIILILGECGKGRQPKVVSMIDMSSACFLSQKLKSIYTFSRLFAPWLYLSDPFFLPPPILFAAPSAPPESLICQLLMSPQNFSVTPSLLQDPWIHS